MHGTDRYIIVTTSSQQAGVIKATDALEDAGIPVMVQHILKHSSAEQRQYRVMVPDRYSTRASQVIAPYLLMSN